MKKILAIVICGLVFVLSACGKGDTNDEAPYETIYEQEYDIYEPEPETEIEYIPVIPAYLIPHGQIAVRHIEFMNDNLYGRGPFTYREKEAAMWIVEELLAMGHNWDDIIVQEFSWADVSAQAERWFGRTWMDITQPRFMRGTSPRAGRLSQNVILTIPGQSGQKIIVGAHYDSLAYPGASDNASGTALLLESAHRMRYQDNFHTIIYVFFGAEEPGLFGAYYFLKSLSEAEQGNIVMMVNADVLFEGPYMIFGAGYVPAQYWWDGPPQGAQGWGRVADWWVENLEPRGNNVTARVDEIAADLNALHSIEIIRNPHFVFSGSDHWIFAWEGHTVVNLLGMERAAYSGYFLDSGFTTRVLHSPRDDFHYINENWPGKIDRNMRYFSIFLEEMLLARYDCRPFSELLRTGEFITAEQMETLKAQALSWQSTHAGVGAFARVVAIDPPDGSAQQVYVTFGDHFEGRFVSGVYERIQILASEGIQVRSLGASSGAGSGEFYLAYRFTTDDYEWVEVFLGYADWLFYWSDVDAREAEWPNLTGIFSEELLQRINDDGWFN